MLSQTKSASIPPCNSLIAQVHEAYVADGSMLVAHGQICMLPTTEVAAYRKLARSRANALAPGASAIAPLTITALVNSNGTG